jgi:hypothetical protein
MRSSRTCSPGASRSACAYPPNHMQAVFAPWHRPLPVTEQTAAQIMSRTFHPAMTEQGRDLRRSRVASGGRPVTGPQRTTRPPTDRWWSSRAAAGVTLAYRRGRADGRCRRRCGRRGRDRRSLSRCPGSYMAPGPAPGPRVIRPPSSAKAKGLSAGRCLGAALPTRSDRSDSLMELPSHRRHLLLLERDRGLVGGRRAHRRRVRGLRHRRRHHGGHRLHKTGRHGQAPARCCHDACRIRLPRRSRRLLRKERRQQRLQRAHRSSCDARTCRECHRAEDSRCRLRGRALRGRTPRYADDFANWARERLWLTLRIVSRPQGTKGFFVLHRRWKVERTIGRCMNARRTRATTNASRSTPKPT